MTGRRLYEIYTDALADVSTWDLRTDGFQQPTGAVKAWSFLTRGERAMFNRMARRVPVAGRRGPGAKR